MLGQFSIQNNRGNRGWYWSSETTLANEIIYYLLFNSPYKTGIVSLELDAGQYGQSSYFLGTLTTKFHLLKVLIIGWLI